MVISLRLFIAISLPESWTAALHSASAVLRKHSLHGSFTRRENFHLTLAFLGETERRAAAEAAMDRVSAPGFVLQIGAPGLFRQRDGDLWWLGIEPSPALLEVHRQLTEELSASGFVL